MAMRIRSPLAINTLLFFGAVSIVCHSAMTGVFLLLRDGFAR
jgi:hypothetical protein